MAGSMGNGWAVSWDPREVARGSKIFHATPEPRQLLLHPVGLGKSVSFCRVGYFVLACRTARKNLSYQSRWRPRQSPKSIIRRAKSSRARGIAANGVARWRRGTVLLSP